MACATELALHVNDWCDTIPMIVKAMVCNHWKPSKPNIFIALLPIMALLVALVKVGQAQEKWRPLTLSLSSSHQAFLWPEI